MTAANPVELARAMVRIPSVNPALEDGGAGEAAMAELTAGWLRGWGYRPATTEVAPGRWNVVARRGGGSGPSLLLNGHLDTVGVAGMAEPFSGAVRRGRLHGRGAADMKAGVACVLATAEALSAEEIPGELIVALTADEEHASLGMAALVDQGLRADAAIVCEPTSLAIMPAHKGFMWIDVRTRGHSAHGSRPALGVDAIAHMGRVLVAFDHEAQRLARATNHPLLGPASVHAGTIRGGSAPSVYPDDCRVVMERRTLPGETPAGVMREVGAVLDQARARCPELDAVAEAGLFRAGTEVEADSDLVQGLRAACARLNEQHPTGDIGMVRGMSAWVDAGFLNQSGTPAVCFGPGSIAQAHAAEEWVEVAEIEVCSRALTDFARSFLRGPGGQTQALRPSR